MSARDIRKWKGLITNVATVALLVLLFLRASWMSEYAAHREAVLSVSGGTAGISSTAGTSVVASGSADNPDGAVFPDASGTWSSGSLKTGTGLFFDAKNPVRFAPDPAAEALETVITGPNPDIQKRLLSLIRSAQTEILLNVYLLTDPSVTDELVAAQKRGVEVRVILEKDPYQLPGANRKSRDQLLSAGIDVFSSRDAFAFVHAKFAVTDRKDYVFSTGNYTKTTFAKNREFFVFGSDPGSAAFLRSVFVADFRGSPFVGPVPDRFYLAPVDARSKILSLVRNAKKSVTVFAPSVSDEEFVNALRTAASEGKKVRVCLLKDASDKDVSIFGPGVDVVRTRRAQLHAKTVLTDGKLLLIGSANFTENSLNRNRETGALFSGERLISNYENTLSDDCKW